MIHATCEDYRAGITCDCNHDAADRDAGRKIRCPLLVLWGARRSRTRLDEIWKAWADDVRGEPIECGHFIPEEAPEATLHYLIPFFEQ
jgi:haloacetate dehalogenase